MFFSVLKCCGYIHSGITTYNTSIMGNVFQILACLKYIFSQTQERKWKLLQPSRLQLEISKQGSSHRDSSLLSLVLGGVFPCIPSIRDSSCRTEIWASALTLVSKTLWLWSPKLWFIKCRFG